MWLPWLVFLGQQKLCHLTPAAAFSDQQVRKLEKEYDVRLFNRIAKQVTVRPPAGIAGTDAAQWFLRLRLQAHDLVCHKHARLKSG